MRVIPGRDGMSDVIATVPTVIADGIFDRLTQQAQIIVDARERGDDDTRRIDEVRADVFADLLLAGAPAAHNTFAAPEQVVPAELNTSLTADGFTATLPPCSVAAFVVNQ